VHSTEKNHITYAEKNSVFTPSDSFAAGWRLNRQKSYTIGNGRIFCTSSSDIVNECRMYFGSKLPSEIIPMRFDKFMSKLSNVGVVETY